MLKAAIFPVVLLTISNAFMTIAWYGHLKFERTVLWKVVLVSWLIAFFEYCFQVPANRLGNVGGLTGYQLKMIQEVITLAVFCVFAFVYLGEKLRWNYLAGFACVLLGVFFVFHRWTA
ncbi:MAG: DMT family protein [Tepidisphaeraceae bacterium]|jgi:uncharacterized protein (DUF486 family)